MGSQGEVYTIRVQGLLDLQWSDWFNGFRISAMESHPPVTLLTGRVGDQAVLRGVLNKLWDLNLTLLSVTCLEEASIPDAPARDAREHPVEEVENED